MKIMPILYAMFYMLFFSYYFCISTFFPRAILKQFLNSFKTFIWKQKIVKKKRSANQNLVN